jgi:hypothetical protein
MRKAYFTSQNLCSAIMDLPQTKFLTRSQTFSHYKHIHFPFIIQIVKRQSVLLEAPNTGFLFTN